jgi:ligand-binding SRPBCC domain-containing protein
MAIIVLVTSIHAPVQRIFDLSRSIDLHKMSTRQTNEEAVAGVTKGLIGKGESVTWKAKHLFKVRYFTSAITGFEPPFYFKDEMQKGDFKHFSHEHFFSDNGNGQTLMKDSVELEAPYGFFGKMIMEIFLKNYIKKFLLLRNEMIKDHAESEKWKSIITDGQ